MPTMAAASTLDEALRQCRDMDASVNARLACYADAVTRRRALVRLRRELRRVAGRDFFPPPQRDAARAAVEDLAAASRQAEVRT